MPDTHWHRQRSIHHQYIASFGCSDKRSQPDTTRTVHFVGKFLNCRCIARQTSFFLDSLSCQDIASFGRFQCSNIQQDTADTRIRTRVYIPSTLLVNIVVHMTASRSNSTRARVDSDLATFSLNVKPSLLKVVNGRDVDIRARANVIYI
jgi:hypothetical protein